MEKWAKHYSSMHQILLVGEGDFSFSLSLAIAFGSASNIVATSLDSYATLWLKYSKAQSNLEKLKKMGATIIHEVDATKMKFHVGLKWHKFDRIVFNFPHAGFRGKEDDTQLISLHQELVQSFFSNASSMLCPSGEVHVSHKTTAPFCDWNLVELAYTSSLAWSKCEDFRIEDYPGYNNKRGDGPKSDDPFPLGKCSTFMFVIDDRRTNMLLGKRTAQCFFEDSFYYPEIGYGQLVETSRRVAPRYNYLINHQLVEEASRRVAPRCNYFENPQLVEASRRVAPRYNYFENPQLVEASRRVASRYNYLRNQVEVYGCSICSSHSRMEGLRRMRATQSEEDEEIHHRALVLFYGRGLRCSGWIQRMDNNGDFQ